VRVLIDTNILSELRKGRRCNDRVKRWYDEVADEDAFLSVLTIGEIRRGIDSIARRDPKSAAALDRWFRTLIDHFAERLLVVDSAIAGEWGRMNVPDPLPVIDGLLAATASVHDLTLVTRNTRHVARTGVRYLNPFQSGSA
jgi:predicted nucleic acid-binding protein